MEGHDLEYYDYISFSTKIEIKKKKKYKWLVREKGVEHKGIVGKKI